MLEASGERVDLQAWRRSRRLPRAPSPSRRHFQRGDATLWLCLWNGRDHSPGWLGRTVLQSPQQERPAANQRHASRNDARKIQCAILPDCTHGSGGCPELKPPACEDRFPVTCCPTHSGRTAPMRRPTTRGPSRRACASVQRRDGAPDRPLSDIQPTSAILLELTGSGLSGLERTIGKSGHRPFSFVIRCSRLPRSCSSTAPFQRHKRRTIQVHDGDQWLPR